MQLFIILSIISIIVSIIQLFIIINILSMSGIVLTEFNMKLAHLLKMDTTHYRYMCIRLNVAPSGLWYVYDTVVIYSLSNIFLKSNNSYRSGTLSYHLSNASCCHRNTPSSLFSEAFAVFVHQQL